MAITSSLEEFIDKDLIASLESYFEKGVIHDIPMSHLDVDTLWDACWDAWLACDPTEHLELGAFMATVKVAYPELPGKPRWAVVGDPEDV